jgi:hypothetical protein
MTARETYNASVLIAATTKAATVAAAETTKQTLIDGSNSVVGYTTSAGNYGNLAAAIKAAALAKANSLFAAEQTKQAALAVARDVLRTAGGDAGAF